MKIFKYTFKHLISVTMTIPEDLKAQQCKGLAAATSTAGFIIKNVSSIIDHVSCIAYP